MARDTLTIQAISSKTTPYDLDVAWTAGVAANDMQFANNGNTILLVKNAGTSGTQTVTVVSVADEYGRTGDLSIAVGQGKYAFVGPLLPGIFNQSDGNVYLNFTTEDNLSFAAVSYQQIR